jgi:hypothetical protein
LNEFILKCEENGDIYKGELFWRCIVLVVKSYYTEKDLVEG